MDEILNGKYKNLKQDPIGEGSQGIVFIFENIKDRKKWSNYIQFKVLIWFKKSVFQKDWQSKWVKIDFQKKKWE